MTAPAGAFFKLSDADDELRDVRSFDSNPDSEGEFGQPDDEPSQSWFNEVPSASVDVPPLLNLQDNNPPIHEPTPPSPIKPSPALHRITPSPVLHRISSTRVPDAKENIKVLELATMLDRELNSSRDWGVKLLEHIFPDKVLGLAVSKLSLANTDHCLTFLQVTDQILLWLEEQGEYADGAFTNPYKPTEVSVATFMNRIAVALEKSFIRHLPHVTRPTLRRLWTADYCDKILPGSSINRKPDIILLDANAGAGPNGSIVLKKKGHPDVTWLHVMAVAEVTSRDKFHRTLKNTIDAKTFIMFLTQHDRNFVPMVSFFQQYCLLTITDREGQQHGKIIYMAHRRPSELLDFLRILIALMFAPDYVVGLDSTMTRNDKHEIVSISVNRERFEVVELLYSVQSLLGRGTKVWQVSLNDKHYVLKDSWILSGRPKESDILTELKGLPGVPTIYAGCVVQHPELTLLHLNVPVPLSTMLFRPIVSKTSRQRRRLVETPLAEPLSSFGTLIELLVAFLDFVSGMSYYFSMLGI